MMTIRTPHAVESADAERLGCAMCIGLRSGSNDVLPSIKGRKTLNRWNPQETGAHWRATGARVTVRRVNSGGTQAAFATYLQDEAHTLWEVDENDAYGLALDTLSLTVESLPDDDPDLIYLQQFVEGGVFVPPDELFLGCFTESPCGARASHG